MDHYKHTSETWNKLASLYRDTFMELKLYNGTYDLFCKHIEKPGASVLEIGCGPGNITKYLLSKRADLKITATDVAPNMLLLAKEQNPTAQFQLMDCRELDQLNASFDAIICGFCLPYLAKADVVKLIKDCAERLNKRGIVYFSTIEGRYEQSAMESSSNGEHSMFVYYYEADFLQEELEKNKFRIIKLEKVAYTRGNGTADTHLIFIAGK